MRRTDASRARRSPPARRTRRSRGGLASAAGYTDVVSRHNRFYARVQRKQPAGWSILYSFPPCDPANPVYPNCVPAGTYETNYYADPSAAVPANPISFEIDEAGLGVWTMWE